MLVRIEACGLCHTDIHAAQGDWPVKPTPPFVPGHEGVGIVEQVGARRHGRTRSATASRSPGSATPAAHCRYCIDWSRDAVRAASSTAATRSTARFAEYAVVDADFAVPVPDGVEPVRRRAAELRGRHDIQGRSRSPTCSPARPSRSSASAASATSPCSTPDLVGAVVDRGRHRRREARAGHGARRRPRRQRGEGRTPPRPSRPSAAPMSRVALRRVARGVRAGLRARCAAAAGWSAWRCPADGTMQHPDLRHRAQAASRSSARSSGTRQDLAEVFALHARGRTRVDRRGAQARRGQRGDRRGAVRQHRGSPGLRALSGR